MIPLIGGILLSNTFENATNMVPFCCVSFASSFLLTIIIYYSSGRLSQLYGYSLSLSFFFLGAWLSSREISKVVVEWPEEREIHQGVLTDYPSEKSKSYCFNLTLLDSAYHGINIILYVPKDSTAIGCKPGETILFRGIIQKPKNDTSIVDFDYAKYLYRHSVSGTLWVNKNNWCKTDSEHISNIKIRALRIRMLMLEKYRQWGFKDDVLAVIAAVSLGYKEELSEELRTAYSSSGASHILAVSGLHVGIMCSFLFLIFRFFVNVKNRRWIIEVIVIVVMWSYSIVIGLPLSITRSMIMFTVLSVCRCFGRENSSINSLASAALSILLFQPSVVYDISFQLSFLAVLFILLLGSRITGLIKTKTVLGEYFWSIIAISISAQIGTMPIVMYNFSNFSTYFLITNIILIPIFFVIVSLTVVLWMVSFIPLLRMIVVEILTVLTSFVNNMVGKIEQLPYSNLSIQISDPFAVCILYAMILLFISYLIEKKTHRLVQIVACFTIWSLYILVESVSKLFEV